MSRKKRDSRTCYTPELLLRYLVHPALLNETQLFSSLAEDQEEHWWMAHFEPSLIAEMNVGCVGLAYQ